MSETADMAKPHEWTSQETQRRVRRRYAADRRLRFMGLAAISAAILLLGILIASIVMTGYKAFYQTKVELEIFVDPKVISKEDPSKGNYRLLVRRSLEKLFPDVTNRREKRNLRKILSSSAHYVLRDYIVDHPDLVGKTIPVLVAVSDPFDQLHKQVIPRRIEALSGQQMEVFNELLKARGLTEIKDGKAFVKLNVLVDRSKIDAADPTSGNYSSMLADALRALIPARAMSSPMDMLASDAANVLRDYVVANPDKIGGTIENFPVPLEKKYAALAKGEVPMMLNPRFASEKELEWFDKLEEQGLVRTPLNWELIFNSDSRFPEQAGLAGAIVGSFYTLLVTLLISFPVGVAAAVYLEEFAPSNRITAFIEVNINNLAAVPSVVFGLLGLALFLGTFGLPRSAPLVGGMVLSLMTLPTIIIATRAALKAVPPSIREAALGVGASKHQVVMHHVLPLAIPGILTGTIIGLAQALGETAPLLLVGMNAFITSPPGGVLEPATSLPTQIYSWADSPERGFVSRTSAAILVLLSFLVIMNAIAIYLRQRLERKW